MLPNSPPIFLNSKFRQPTEQENKRITLNIYNEGLKLIDAENQQLVGQIANYFIPHAMEDVVKVNTNLCFFDQ